MAADEEPDSPAERRRCLPPLQEAKLYAPNPDQVAKLKAKHARIDVTIQFAGSSSGAAPETEQAPWHLLLPHDPADNRDWQPVQIPCKKSCCPPRHVGCITRQPPIQATEATDPKELSEVRQEVNEVAQGVAALSGQLKEILNRIAASRPKRTNRAGNEIIRTKMDSGACDLVIGPEVVQDYPLWETEASRRGIAYISASGDAMPNHGE